MYENWSKYSLKSLSHIPSYIFMITLMTAAVKCIRENPGILQAVRQYEVNLYSHHFIHCGRDKKYDEASHKSTFCACIY